MGSRELLKKLRKEGFTLGRHKVRTLMEKLGLKVIQRQAYKVTTMRKHSHQVADNLINQAFNPEKANQVWAGDVTYLRTHEGWMYLAIVMDLYSRRIVGWSMDRWISRHLAIDALHMALGSRLPEEKMIHHSDRGSQYTSDDFRSELDEHGIQCSMSGRGHCYDNAVVESFFGLLKRERVNRVRYRTRD